MDIIKFLRLVLAFREVSSNDASMYVNTIKTYTEDFLLDDIKSLKFGNVLEDARKISLASSARLEGEVIDIGTVLAVQYSVGDENANRYAFFSEKYPVQVFLRMFNNEKKLNKFLSNPKISATRESMFKGVRIVEYTSEGSKLVRHALFIPEGLVITDADVAEFCEQQAMPAANAEKTAVFG